MKKFLAKIEVPFKNYIFVAVLLNLAIVTLIFVLKSSVLPPEVPLFYGLPQGEDQLAKTTLLVIPSFVSIVIIFINSTIAYVVKDNFIKRSLVVSGILSVLFPLATTLKIIFLVGTF